MPRVERLMKSPSMCVVRRSPKALLRPKIWMMWWLTVLFALRFPAGYMMVALTDTEPLVFGDLRQVIYRPLISDLGDPSWWTLRFRGPMYTFDFIAAPYFIIATESKRCTNVSYEMTRSCWRESETRRMCCERHPIGAILSRHVVIPQIQNESGNEYRHHAVR